MKKHILYCSICCPTQKVFAQRLSEKYGYGYDDHAVIMQELFSEQCFKHQINFRTVCGSAMSYASYIQRDHLTVAMDDDFLEKVLPFTMQSLNMLGRQLGYDSNYTVLERCYLSGIGFWRAYLLHHKIDLVIFFCWPHEGNDFFLYQVCKILGISTLIYCFSICPSRSYVAYTVEDEIPALVSRYEKLRKEYAEYPIEQITLGKDYADLFEKMSNPQSNKTPDYMQKRYLEFLSLSRHLVGYSVWDKYIADRKKGGQLKGISWKIWAKAMIYRALMLDFKLTNGVVVKLILRVKNRHYKQTQKLWQHYEECCQKPDYAKKYVYFPLHYQPECTSNPQGGGIYYQQMIPVRLLAESLPEDVFVFVKEHPAQQYGAREKGFYDELCSIPNVVLVKPETDTYELIKHSIAVSTLIGTAGWEGLFFNKPFLMFGYWVTQHMPGVYHVRTKEDCKAAVNSILRGECQFTLKDIKIFLKAMDETEGWGLSLESELPDSQELELQISSSLKQFEQAMGL